MKSLNELMLILIFVVFLYLLLGKVFAFIGLLYVMYWAYNFWDTYKVNQLKNFYLASNRVKLD
jgi:hypothetical protein